MAWFTGEQQKKNYSMSNKNFFDRLVDPTDKSVEPHVVFILWGVLAVIVYGLVQLFLSPDMAKINEFGIAMGSLLGGGGVYAGGTGMQSKVNQ